MTQSPEIPKSSLKSKPMTAQMCKAIRFFCELYPYLTNAHVAEVFEVNQRQVSEVKSGKYDELIKQTRARP